MTNIPENTVISSRGPPSASPALSHASLNHLDDSVAHPKKSSSSSHSLAQEPPALANEQYALETGIRKPSNDGADDVPLISGSSDISTPSDIDEGLSDEVDFQLAVEVEPETTVEHNIQQGIDPKPLPDEDLDGWRGAYAKSSQDNDLPCLETFTTDSDQGVEDEFRQSDLDPKHYWALCYASPPPSPSNSSSSSNGILVDLSTPMYQELSFIPNRVGMLMTQFYTQTCGILSIKDGPNENPWRTMLPRMADMEPALKHAIISLTAFHASSYDAAFRVLGIEHVQLSIGYLRSHIGTMRTDAALATSLVLAFIESWDRHTSSGITHLRGARKLVIQGLEDQLQAFQSIEDLETLSFLYNTWLYMDVIARLTSFDDNDSEDTDMVIPDFCGPQDLINEVDPLMGCAATLFPLIGKVANLVRSVRRAQSISPTIIDEAANLKRDIKGWTPPQVFQEPEDQTTEVTHSVNTARAYRSATLLHLFQAVPLIANQTSASLAEEVLNFLAAVPSSSRVIIIHIFPLLAAGCEAVGDNRRFVEERWAIMIERMRIGNLNRSWDVVREVWRRRDARKGSTGSDISNSHAGNGTKTAFKCEDSSTHDSIEAPHESRRRSILGPMSSRASTDRQERVRRKSTETMIMIDPEMTVRGSMHWISVMIEWEWQSKLQARFLLLTQADVV